MTQRQERVGEVVQREVSRLLSSGEIEGTGFVTVTRVEMSGDLRIATVLYSVYGGERSQQDTAAVLSGARGRIRKAVGQAVHLRYVPEIRFRFDPAVEGVDRMDRLLREVGTGASERDPDEE